MQKYVLYQEIAFRQLNPKINGPRGSGEMHSFLPQVKVSQTLLLLFMKVFRVIMTQNSDGCSVLTVRPMLPPNTTGWLVLSSMSSP